MRLSSARAWASLEYMADEMVPQSEVDAWVDAITRLYYGGAWDPGDADAAEHAVANLWSEFGFLDAPMAVLQMFTHAIEVGYMSALRDVREGSYDAELVTWRPDLSCT